MWKCCVSVVILGDVIFICVEFIRVCMGVGELDRVRERWYRDSLFYCGSWGEFKGEFG